MEMTADDVISIYTALQGAGLETRIDGGWAVDLDIAIRSGDLSALRACLADHGFRRETARERATLEFCFERRPRAPS